MKYLSFPLALILHILVFWLITFFVDKKPVIVFSAPLENAIELHIGHVFRGEKTSKESAGEETKEKKDKKKETAQSPKPKKLTTSTDNVVINKAQNKTQESEALNLSSETSSGFKPSSAVSSEEGGKRATVGFDESIQFFKEPIYPKIGIKRNLEGEVKLRLKISAEGIPLESEILKSSTHESLDQAALVASKTWRFQKLPGNGYYFVEKIILFKLQNQ